MIALNNKESSLQLDEDCGLTIISWKYKGVERIEIDYKRIESGRTSGIPILFPTPNRTKNEHYIFEKKIYPGYMHGLARFQKFKILNQTPFSCKGILVNKKETQMYDSFPFLFVLTIEIILEEKGISWNFEIENKDTKNMPYGIAIHPYVKKMGASWIRCSAEFIMENDESLCPLGTLRFSDIQQTVNVDNKDMDLVFYSEKVVVTEFSTGDTLYRFFGSDAFRHTVIYTPKQESFVCIEPQSCSSDAINLFERGYKKISGLQILYPGEKKDAMIKIEIDKI